jgi:hypothetical protein
MQLEMRFEKYCRFDAEIVDISNRVDLHIDH